MISDLLSFLGDELGDDIIKGRNALSERAEGSGFVALCSGLVGVCHERINVTSSLVLLAVLVVFHLRVGYPEMS
jgi:hypothetical protein